MKLNDLLKGLEVIETVGDLNLDITNIHSDSRKIKEGGLFVAINGYKTNGIDYLSSAIENGAVAAIVEPEIDLKSINATIPLIKVQNTRRTLAIISCTFYDNPSRKFKLIGITGTKGKTTSTFMTKALLEVHGLKVGLIGSIAVYIGDEKLEDTDRTTPESPEIQKHFAEMAEANCDAVIIEVSSQAMKLDRVYGCDFDIGLFTNLSEDHISKNEHASMEEYFECKSSLIRMCKLGIINNDDKTVSTLKNTITNIPIKTFAIRNEADITADLDTLKITPSCIDFTMNIDGKKEQIEVGIPGEFSVYNSLRSNKYSS